MIEYNQCRFLQALAAYSKHVHEADEEVRPIGLWVGTTGFLSSKHRQISGGSYIDAARGMEALAHDNLIELRIGADLRAEICLTYDGEVAMDRRIKHDNTGHKRIPVGGRISLGEIREYVVKRGWIFDNVKVMLETQGDETLVRLEHKPLPYHIDHRLASMDYRAVEMRMMLRCYTNTRIWWAPHAPRKDGSWNGLEKTDLNSLFETEEECAEHISNCKSPYHKPAKIQITTPAIGEPINSPLIPDLSYVDEVHPIDTGRHG